MDINTIIIAMVLLVILAVIWHIISKRVHLKKSLEMVFLRVLISKKDSERDDRKETTHDFKEQVSLMEQFLASLKSIHSFKLSYLLFGQPYITLEYVATGQAIYFYLAVPKNLKNLVERQITSFYSDAVVDEVPERNVFKGKKVVRAAGLKLKKDSYIPIKTYQKLESDPANAILTALGKLSDSESSVIQIVIRPAKDSWQEHGKKMEKKLGKHGFFSFNPLVIIGNIVHFFSTATDSKENAEELNQDSEHIKEKVKKTGYETVIRIITAGTDENMTEAQLQNLIASFSQYSAP